MPRVDRILLFLAELRRERFDLALQVKASKSYVNPLTALFDARPCEGFFSPMDFERIPQMWDEMARYPSRKRHELTKIKSDPGFCVACVACVAGYPQSLST
jgi:hypothetical protein